MKKLNSNINHTFENVNGNKNAYNKAFIVFDSSTMPTKPEFPSGCMFNGTGVEQKKQH